MCSAAPPAAARAAKGPILGTGAGEARVLRLRVLWVTMTP